MRQTTSMGVAAGMICSVVYFFAAIFSSVSNCRAESFLFGFMGESLENYPQQPPERGSTVTVDLALEYVRTNTSLLPNVTIQYTVADSRCDEKLALDMFIKLKLVNNISAVIGPACNNEAIATGLLASQWRMPMIGYRTITNILSDKQKYNTYGRVAGTAEQHGRVYFHMFQYMGKSIQTEKLDKSFLCLN